MENQTTETSNTTPTTPVLESPQTATVQTLDPKPKGNSFLVVLLSILLFITVAIAGFFAYQTQTLVKELTLLKSDPAPTSEVVVQPAQMPVATTDPTADWITYTNNVLKYTIRYPKDWVLDKSKAELAINDQNEQVLVISKGDYKLTMAWPSAFGPSICLFDDQTRVNAPEMASYCEGKYVETKNSLGTIIHRRLEIPNKYNEFVVYTFDKTYFVTVPPIRFDVPSNYNIETVSVMDQILLTYTSLN